MTDPRISTCGESPGGRKLSSREQVSRPAITGSWLPAILGCKLNSREQVPRQCLRCAGDDAVRPLARAVQIPPATRRKLSSREQVSRPAGTGQDVLLLVDRKLGSREQVSRCQWLQRERRRATSSQAQLERAGLEISSCPRSRSAFVVASSARESTSRDLLWAPENTRGRSRSKLMRPGVASSAREIRSRDAVHDLVRGIGKTGQKLSSREQVSRTTLRTGREASENHPYRRKAQLERAGLETLKKGCGRCASQIRRKQAQLERAGLETGTCELAR
jgi:hypothetical protein